MPLDPPMSQVIASLRAIPREARKELTPALKQAADPIVQDARRRAGWSGRIPGSISARVRYGGKAAGVTIRTSARRAPHARPYEGLGQGGTFRHPVFGNREVWVTQTRRPFLLPAVQAGRGDVQDAIVRVVDDAVRAHGFA